MQAMRRRDVLRARVPERRKLVLLERAMPSAQARKATAATRRVDCVRATETTTAERMERTSARRRRHRADHPEEKKLMVTAPICRLCENSAIIDPTVAEILAHQAHPHHKRRANPYCVRPEASDTKGNCTILITYAGRIGSKSMATLTRQKWRDAESASRLIPSKKQKLRGPLAGAAGS
jgi:hypothetical protein